MKNASKCLAITIILLLFLANLQAVRIKEIKCDYKTNPLGVSKNPHFSWLLQSDERNVYQQACQVLVSDDLQLLEKNVGNMWDSKKVNTDQSILNYYKGKALLPGKTYFWKVKVWDNKSNESEWSKPAKFVTALFSPSDWKGAKWICYETMDDSMILVPGVHPWENKVEGLAERRSVVPLFRKEFNLKKEIKHAYLFISGLGHYKAQVNGNQVSDDVLSPGWTHYRKSCLYNVYDISRDVTKGANAIGVTVGPGFYNVNNERYRKLVITYGMPLMIAQIRITYTDGSEELIVSDTDWKSAPSPVTFSSIYGGEDYNALLEKPGWNKPYFDDTKWNNSLPAKEPGGKLFAEKSYPVKIMETFVPQKITRLKADTYVYDFGQNASGIFKIKVKGKKGQKIKLIPGELIADDNQVSQRSSGKPHFYEYTLKGEGEEVWQPQFTFYGFRYIQVEGAHPVEEEQSDSPEMLEINHLHTYNSAPHIGEFSCSNELFNKINKLIIYGIQSNFHSVLTDCPHREKLGWLEQTFLMGGSVHFNFDLYHLYSKQIDDMKQAQTEAGLIPDIAPEYVFFGGSYGFRDSPEWGSAGIILPWLIYKWYGDISVMNEAWLMMRKYFDYLESKSENDILTHGLGDWYDLGSKAPGFAQLTQAGVTATAIYYYDAVLMATMADILGKNKDKDYFIKMTGDIKEAFNKRFYNTDKKIYDNGSQTAMAMPFSLGLVDEKDRDAVLKNLTDSIYANDKALTAGDVGFHYLVETLTEGGESQLLYDMNNRDDVPGYGYQLKKGATALTESWAARTANSNNHLMLGHIMEWFYKGLAGIRQEEGSTAYKNSIIKPSPVGDITNVKSYFTTPYGKIYSNWIINENMFSLNIDIPVNTTAMVYIPANKNQKIKESGKLIKKIDNIQQIDRTDSEIIVKVGSGKYSFSVK